jgi:hypothetical protein
MRSEERLQRIERLLDPPLFCTCPGDGSAATYPDADEPPHTVEQAFLAGDWFIWAVFAADYGIKLVVAPRPLA